MNIQKPQPSQKPLPLQKPLPFLILLACLTVLLLASGCSGKGQSVIVYTSVDRNFSEQVFRDFETRTGIKVIAAYDTEASKTTGMVNKLVEEAQNPQADVFWSSEFSQTILLKDRGILMPYQSPSAADIPAKYKDREGYWTAFGGRARCIIVNTHLLAPEDYPTRFADFLAEKYPADKIGLAYPLFGTTVTHAAALYALYGAQAADQFFNQLQARGIRIVDGNGVVRDLVVDGQLLFGMTDTDDALGAKAKGAAIEIILPDQGEDDPGTLIIPNSVALIKKPAQNRNAQVFVDYLLSTETEKYLFDIGWIQVPVRAIEATASGVDFNHVKTIEVSLDDIYQQFTVAQDDLKQIFVR